MIHYYEINFKGPNGNDDIVIKGTCEPTPQEALEFMRSYGDEVFEVLGVYPIDESDARAFYCFDNSDAWPIFS